MGWIIIFAVMILAVLGGIVETNLRTLEEEKRKFRELEDEESYRRMSRRR